MNTSITALVIIVVVVAVGLTVWITAVLRAGRHPGTGGPDAVPRRKIIGGRFRGDPRQQMPRRDAAAEMIDTGNEPGRGG